ncbi:amino acid ABC transporter substrate-binding protein [Clostridium sp. LIBA-8841]|uniref:amino acid ABC transporter substrate-binding protein n=1 Tax=Clostridium sp. LIBA-8841 TaxID=2987530 RepID=UPI002AC59184|nr:amino acid ABC transporter substrate-binding protein [Clostridium sp. LIBA-8841]MDZ5252220.1 amino acid ABC transporter substrate-binding protein [Clostridium sp. LIBA-8841]
MKKVLFLLFSILIFSTILYGCSSKKLENKKDENTVIVGIDDTFVPMGFRDEKGSIVGFDVDLAKEAFKRMNLNVTFQPIDWSMKETELNNGNIDVIWNGYTMTPERAEKVAFTKPYLKNRQVIVTLSDSNIKTLNDLKGKTVTTQDGSSSFDVLFERSDLTKTFKGKEPVLFDSFNDCFMDLEAGRSDAVVCDEILAQYYISKKDQNKFYVLSEDLGEESYSIGLRKDSNLVYSLNKTLEEMKKDGTTANISKKWFGKDLES